VRLLDIGPVLVKLYQKRIMKNIDFLSETKIIIISLVFLKFKVIVCHSQQFSSELCHYDF